MWSCTRNTRRATRRTSAGGTAGCAATGRLPGGCSRGSRDSPVTGSRTRSPCCRGGRSLITSGGANVGATANLAGFFRTMWVGPAISATVTVFLILYGPALFPAAAPLLGLWLVSPVVAWWLSRSLAAPPVRLSGGQQVFLGKL